jgi:hypothetical protein
VTAPWQRALERTYPDYTGGDPATIRAFAAGWDASIEHARDYREHQTDSGPGGTSRELSLVIGLIVLLFLAGICGGLFYHAGIRPSAYPITIVLGIISVLLWRRADRLDKTYVNTYKEKWS